MIGPARSPSIIGRCAGEPSASKIEASPGVGAARNSSKSTQWTRVGKASRDCRQRAHLAHPAHRDPLALEARRWDRAERRVPLPSRRFSRSGASACDSRREFGPPKMPRRYARGRAYTSSACGASLAARISRPISLTMLVSLMTRAARVARFGRVAPGARSAAIGALAGPHGSEREGAMARAAAKNAGRAPMRREISVEPTCPT